MAHDITQWSPQDMAAWLTRVHGGDWNSAELEGPSAIASRLNAAVREGAADLPLDREPASFQRLFFALADKRGGDV